MGEFDRSREMGSRPITPAITVALQNRIAEVAFDFLTTHHDFGLPIIRSDIATITRDFFGVYNRRVIVDNEGGTKFNDSYWIYLIARLRNPAFILESGSHKGHSSWLFRQACPDAEIHCFDVSFAHLEYCDPAITYLEHDWMDVDIRCPDPARSLCFFDDHINHAMRVRQAYERGFRFLTFDDDLGVHNVYATGHPPAPTISMLFDPDLRDGTTLKWMRHDRAKSYTFHEADTYDARSLIAAHAKTPCLSSITRYRPQSGLTIVGLVD